MIDGTEAVKKAIYSWMHRTFKEKGAHSTAGKIALGSTKGLIRHENQDRAAIVTLTPNDTLSVPVQVSVLCDGIGGLKNGAEAATLAISSFVSQLTSISDSNLEGFLEHAANAANKEVYSVYKGGGGCTLSAVSTTPGGVVDIVNYGDSRVYHFNGKELIQLSTDDTLDGQLAKMDRRRENTLPEFKHLVQFVGMEERIETAMIKNVNFAVDDKILIASDGAYEVDIHIAQSILANSTSAEDGVKKLLLLSEWVGGKDNATAIYLPAYSKVENISKVKTPLIEVWTWYAEFLFSYSHIDSHFSPNAHLSQNVNSQALDWQGESAKSKNKINNSTKKYKDKRSSSQILHNKPNEDQTKLVIEYGVEKDVKQ